MDLLKWAVMRFPVICHTVVTDASRRVTPLTQAGAPICYQLYQCSYFTATQNIGTLCGDLLLHILSIYWLDFLNF